MNAGINFQRYQAIALEPSKAVSVLKATNKNIEPDAMEYLTKSAEAYKDVKFCAPIFIKAKMAALCLDGFLITDWQDLTGW